MLPEILQRQKLFSLLHDIDVDLAAEVQARGCPSVGGRCIKGRMFASPVAVPPVYLKLSFFVIVFVAVAKGVASGPYLSQSIIQHQEWQGNS